MSVYDDGVFRKVVVKIRAGENSVGSGCIVPSEMDGLFYCLTARHCVKTDNISLFLTTDHAQETPLEFVDVIKESEAGHDAAILKLLHPYNNYPHVFVGRLNSTYDNARLVGYSQNRKDAHICCDVKINRSDLQGNKTICTNLQNISTYNTDLLEQIVGISGGGCFALDGANDYKLLGIETQFVDEQQSFGEVSILDLSVFNDLLQRNGWPMLAHPKYRYASMAWDCGTNVLERKNEDPQYDMWVDTKASSDIIREIQDYFLSENQEPLLLGGFSGTGKTRTVLQACTQNPVLANALIFDGYDQFCNAFSSGLRTYCKSAEGEPIYLVVDDLKIDEWYELKRDVRPYSNIHVVAIAEMGEGYDRRDIHIRKMIPCDEDDVVKIIHKAHRSLDKEDMLAIHRLSNNDLRFALLIAYIYERAPDRLEWDMRSLSSDSTSARIIVDRIMSQVGDLNRNAAIKIFSLFIDFGFIDGAKKELEFLSSHFQINVSLLTRTIETCLSHHLGIKKGNYFELSPRALARLLFAEYNPELISNLPKFMDEMPTDELRERFIMRAYECGGSTWEEVKGALASWFHNKYAKTSWKASSAFSGGKGESFEPFIGEGKVFLTKEAMIFVEYVPEIGLPWLQRVVSQAEGNTLEQFYWYKGVRREFVWTCEHLACFKENFAICEDILFMLGLHETDHSISNNSRGVWSELFGLILSNTETSFHDRFHLLLRRMKSFQDGWPDQMFKSALGASLSWAGTRLLPPKMVGGRLTPENWSGQNIETLQDLFDIHEWILSVLMDNISNLPLPMQQVVFECLKTHIADYTSAMVCALAPTLRKAYCQTLERCAVIPDMRIEVVIAISTQIELQKHADLRNNEKDAWAQGRLDFLTEWQKQFIDTSYVSRLKVLLSKNVFRTRDEIILEFKKYANELLAEVNAPQLLNEILDRCDLTNYSFAIFATVVGETDKDFQLLPIAERRFAKGDSQFSENYFYGVCSKEQRLPDFVRKMLDECIECNPNGVLHISIQYDLTNSGLDRIVYLLEQGIIDNSVLNLIERRWAERLTLEQAKCILTLLVESKINDGKYHFFCIGCEWLKTFTQPEFAEFLFTHSAHLSFDVLQQHSYEFIRLMEQLPEVILRDCLVLVIRSIDYSYRMRYLVEHIRYIQKHANGPYARDIAFEVCNCIYAHSEHTVLETSCAGLVYLLCTENVLQWIDIEQQKRAEVIAFHLPAPSLSEVSVPEVTQRVLEQYEKNETVFHRFWRGIHACESYSYSEIEESCKRKFAILKQYGEHPSKPIRKWADFEKKRIETLLDEKRRLDAEEMRFRES